MRLSKQTAVISVKNARAVATNATKMKRIFANGWKLLFSTIDKSAKMNREKTAWKIKPTANGKNTER